MGPRIARAMVPIILATSPLAAQQPADSTIGIAPGFTSDQFVAAQAPIELTLSRIPAASEGRIAVLVGTADLTTLFQADGAKLVFHSNGVDLPHGESALKVFLVTGTEWKELAAIPVRVLTPHGFEKAEVDPGVDVRNTGQLAEGHSGSEPAPARSTFQTIGGTFGLQTTHVRSGLSFTSDTHLLGAGEHADALRFAEKGDQAAPIDLADYALRFTGPNIALALGQVSAGTNRHLISGFASRGATAVIGGARASLSLGAQNGTSIVGTDNILGIDHGDHRVLSSSLALEMFPSRPGALHIDATLMQGAVHASTGFNQGGIMSADQSNGYGVQVAASTPSNRVRVAAGVSSSRSEFAADPPIFSGGSLVPLKPHRTGAQYAELNVGVLQGAKLGGAIPLRLDVALHHERVDPLYRSVATPLQSDVERDGIDASGAVDVISVQSGYGRTDDNLNAIASLMTNRSRSTSVSLGAPLAALFRVTRGAALLPTLTYSQQRMHQFGAGIPTGGLFTAADVPDQVIVVQDGSAQWQIHQWQLAYHVNRSDQDNRQPGLQLADFATTTQGVTVGVAATSSLTLGFDLGVDRQESKQLAQINYVRRAGMTANWRATSLTTIDGSVTASRTEDHGAGNDAHVSAVQAGIAQGIKLWHSGDGTPRGQAFLRYGRYSNDLFNLGSSFGPPTQTAGRWNVTSGLSLRLF